MPDDQTSPRPRPGPVQDELPTNFVVDRRKIVIALGFGAATFAGLRPLDANELVETAAPGVSTAPDSAQSPVTTQPVVSPFVAPVLDESKRLAPAQTADVVLAGGRIIDPETGFDRVGNVALLGPHIVEVSEDPIAATTTINASALVVSPGFIDMLSYQPNGYGEWWKLADGVTSNIGMHGLRFDASDFYNRWTGEGVPIHFGGAVHTSHVRAELGILPDDPAETGQITTITEAIEQQIQSGYLGIHAQPEYAPGVGPTELMDMGHLAARLDVPLCVHARFSDNLAPGLQSEATAELVQVARETGAHVHVEHLNSTGGTGRMADALDEISVARAEGLKITSCMYPYEFWATTLRSARFRDWQEKFGLDYSDLQVAGTSTRLDEASFQRAFDENLLTAAFAIPPGDINLGMEAPFMMIGSDAILESTHNNHPRSTGCFARTLGEYVRGQGVVPLIDALAMMTIRPSKLLTPATAAMATKGRLQIGADADITVFDPLAIADMSTIENPAQESIGVQYVFVNGVAVRREGVTDRDGTLPGTAVTSRLSAV